VATFFGIISPKKSIAREVVARAANDEIPSEKPCEIEKEITINERIELKAIFTKLLPIKMVEKIKAGFLSQSLKISKRLEFKIAFNFALLSVARAVSKDEKKAERTKSKIKMIPISAIRKTFPECFAPWKAYAPSQILSYHSFL
jgi:hypothetical protein